MRLIDADALKQVVGSYNPVKYTYEYGLVITLEDIEKAPSVCVPERKFGEWKEAMIDESMGWKPKVHYCSVCNHITTFRSFYCPNCGAYMRKETAKGDYENELG